MTKCLSIALTIYRLTPRGGLEDNCLRFAQALMARGHKPVIFTAEPAEVAGFDIRPLTQAMLPASNHRRMEKLSLLANEAIRTGNFDRSIAFQMMPGTDFVFLADPMRRARGRNSWKWLTSRFHVYKSLESRTLGRDSRSRIIGLSDRQMQAFVERYDLTTDRYRIAPPTLSKAKIRPESRSPEIRAAVRKRLDIPDSAPVLLAAVLHPWTKGLDRTIDALKQLPEAVLLVAGLDLNGHMADEVVRKSKGNGTADRVRFLGFLDPAALLDLMAAADVLAHPARREVTGAVILESIVNGLPVIATDVCGFSSHIEQSGAGEVLSGPFTGKAYVDALKRVIASSESMSARGKAYGENPWLASGMDQVCDWIVNGF